MFAQQEGNFLVIPSVVNSPKWVSCDGILGLALLAEGSQWGSVATLQEWSDMLRQCSLRDRFPVCSSGGNSNRKSSFWRLVGI